MWLPKFPDDQFSLMEKAVANEINFCRSDPAAYAQILELHYIMEGPFLINKPPQDTRRHLEKLQAQLQRSHQEFEAKRRQREDGWMVRKEELLNAINATKKGKGAKKPSKKETKEAAKPSTAPMEENAEELLEREQSVFEAEERVLQGQHHAVFSEAEHEIGRVQAAISRVEACTAYLRGQPAMPWLEYSRGLSLATRAHHLMKKTVRAERPGPVTSIEDRVAMYGTVIGDVTEVVYQGVDTAQQMLASLVVKEFECTAAMGRPSVLFLHRRFTQLGVGWGRPLAGRPGGLCAIALAERFMESHAIRQRPHLDLQCLLRELEQCHRPEHSTTQIILQSPAAIGPIWALQPREHPVTLAERGTIVELEVPRDVVLAASLECVMRGLGATTAVMDDSVLVQHLETVATIHVVLPSPGLHRLMVFAKKKGVLRFTPVGAISLRARFPEVAPQAGLPQTHVGFGDLRCCLRGPLINPLKAMAEYDFEVRVDLAREAELQQRRQEVADSHHEEVEKVVQLHAAEVDRIHHERQELEAELRRISGASIEPLAGDRAGPSTAEKKKKIEKPKTPQAPSPKRAPPKKGVDLAELETKAAHDRLEQERAALRRQLRELDGHQAAAEHQFKTQQQWLQEKQAKSLQMLEARGSQAVEVALVNGPQRRLLTAKPGEPHWYSAHAVKVTAGTVAVMVDGTFLGTWKVEPPV